MPEPVRRLRLFLALELPPDVRGQLASLLTDLPAARWVRPAQLHVTLRFLGSVAEDRLPELRSRLAAVVVSGAFSLQVASVGTFPERPTRRSPARVLWAGAAPAAPVAALKRAIDDSLGPDPEAVDRPFHPHITLARFKDDPGPALGAYLSRHALLASPPFAVTAFHLYESRTLPDGPEYSALHSRSLLAHPGQAPFGDRA